MINGKPHQLSVEYNFVNKLTESHKNQLLQLYHQEWWSKERTPQDVEDVLKGSTFIIGMVQKDLDTLIGFARVLTDHFKYAYVYDVIIKQEYRGIGLGHILIEEIINHPKINMLKNIELTCGEEMCSFYEKYSFSKDYGTSVPMRRSNPEGKS